MRKSKICLIFLLCMQIQILNAEITGNIATKIDEKYLKDFPELSLENLRYLLPAENWANYKKFLAKGKYIQIIKEELGSGIQRYNGPLKFYETRELKQSPFLVYQNNNVTVQGKESCSYSDERKIVDGAYKCAKLFCKYESGKVKVNNYGGMGALVSFKEKCQYWPDMYDSSSYPDYYSTSLKIQESLTGSDSVRTEINGKTFFLDTRFCKKSLSSCNEINIKFSLLEEAWMSLKHVQDKKNYPTLNILIKNLLPCVKNRDEKCVKGFFMTKEDAIEADNLEFESQVMNISNEIYKDLETCLKYENLLPFGGRTRATDGKICIFSPTQPKIYSITLPDAYNFRGDKIFVNYDI